MAKVVRPAAEDSVAVEDSEAVASQVEGGWVAAAAAAAAAVVAKVVPAAAAVDSTVAVVR